MVYQSVYQLLLANWSDKPTLKDTASHIMPLWYIVPLWYNGMAWLRYALFAPVFISVSGTDLSSNLANDSFCTTNICRTSISRYRLVKHRCLDYG